MTPTPTDQIDMKVHTQLGRAKARLIIDHPFYASLLCNMPLIECLDLPIPTAATDGKTIYYDPRFFAVLTPDETRFVLCHEVMHCVFQHMFRVGERDKRVWNIAGDVIINEGLLADRIGTLPEGGVHSPKLYADGGALTTGVYDLLMKDEKQNPQGVGGGKYGMAGVGQMDDCLPAPGDAAEQAQAEADMRVAVAQAAQAAKMCGKLSDGLERFVEQALKPKVDWKAVLRNFVSVRAKVEYSYARPRRRFAGEDIYLASMGGEAMGDILIAVDCSGSIGEEELAVFAAEILAIKEDMRPRTIHVTYFDSQVCHYDRFDQDDELQIAPHGGGGTAFSPIFRFADEHGIDPVCCVVLTDLYCSDFGPPTPYPTLWVTTAATDAPWGQVVEMKD